MKLNENVMALMRETQQLLKNQATGAASEALQRVVEGMGLGTGLGTNKERSTSVPPEVTFPNFVNDLLSGLTILSPLGKMPFAEPKQEEEAELSEGGRFIRALYTDSSGGTHRYKLFIPSGYNGQSLPLIVMLHGCTQDPDDFAVGTRMNAIAEEQHCFVAYPAQTPSANHSKCWNWFKALHQQRDQGEASLIAGITRDIIKKYSINERKVYIAGLSAGGAMALVMATVYPELYAATGVHSGLPYASAHDLPSAMAAMKNGTATGSSSKANQRLKAIPIIVFHGNKDTTVHPRNGEHIMEQTVEGGAKQAFVETGRVPNGHAYTRSMYYGDSGEVTAEHWLVHDAGHAWSGGNSRGTYTDVKGPNASKEMMRFFLSVPK